MKKEFVMPEMKVSKFSMENIVTDSAARIQAEAALKGAGVKAEYTTYVDFNEMFNFSN